MGKPKIRPPHRIKTPDSIEIKFGTVDYVGEMTPQAKFHVNLHKGASRQIGEIYAEIFIALRHRSSYWVQLVHGVLFCVIRHNPSESSHKRLSALASRRTRPYMP